MTDILWCCYQTVNTDWPFTIFCSPNIANFNSSGSFHPVGFEIIGAFFEISLSSVLESWTVRSWESWTMDSLTLSDNYAIFVPIISIIRLFCIRIMDISKLKWCKDFYVSSKQICPIPLSFFSTAQIMLRFLGLNS